MAIKKTLILIYFLTLLPRLYQLSATAVYPDEVTWMVKGKETIYALAKFNLDYFRHAWWNDTTETYAIGLPVVVLNGLSHVLLAGTSKYSLHLLPDILASRLPIIFLHSLLPPALYLFCRRFFGHTSALVAALAYSLAPVAIGTDRWVIHDSSLTLFSFLAVTTYIYAKHDARISLLPGFFLGMAFLVKPTGLFPGISWLLLAKPHRLFFTNILTATLTILILWPQSWFKPLTSIPEYIFRQQRLAQLGLPNFHLGVITKSPGGTFYFERFLNRTPEVVIITLLLGLYFYLRQRRTFSVGSRRVITALGAYFLSFLWVISTTPAKAGLRYALPLIPWVYVVAGWALSRLRSRRFFSSVYLTFLLFPLSYYPNFSLYYNWISGGPRRGQQHELVGLCLGSKAAFQYLDSNKIPGVAAILGCADTGPYDTGRQLTKDWKTAVIVVLETAHRQQFPESPEIESLKNRTPIKSIEENGVVTAEIYR